MTRDIDDLARLFHEALSQLGWEADASELAERVKRLDLGLPIEDEFMVLCAWLGKCALIHKLDQTQMPQESRGTVQVPDLIGTFNYQGRAVTVLIEVKATTDNVLSLRPDYVERLKAYAARLNLPVLIAWKWHSVWCLFDIARCVQMDKNFNINWKGAIKDSLLGAPSK